MLQPHSNDNPSHRDNQPLQNRAKRVIEPLIPPDAEERVTRAYRQWNQIVRDHIRNETALRLTDGDGRNSIQVRVVGNLATAKRRVLLMGCVHGNECEGVPVLRSIAKSTPPAGVAYVIFTYPNPDGRTARTRGNARGVDLNRNAIGWRAAYSRGHSYYPGTGPLSEPESVAIHDVFRAARPTAFMSFHQALRCIDFSGRGKQWAGTYARISGLPVKELSAYRGSIGTWVGNRYPNMVSLTVELPRPVPAWMIDSNIAAVKRVATRH